MPADGLDARRDCDAISFGSAGDPDIPEHVTLWGLRLEICQGFDRYAKVRPARILRGVESPRKRCRREDLDWIIVRENSEGQYSGVGGRVHQGQPMEAAMDVSIMTRAGVERIMRLALAGSRPRRLLTVVTRSSAQRHAMVVVTEAVCAFILADPLRPASHAVIRSIDMPRSHIMVRILSAALALVAAAASPAFAQTPACPNANLMYWQAFPPGGESDLSARHQQMVLKKKCPAIETVIQYKAGAGGGLLWSQMNTLPGDGVNVVGINLPHMVLQPMEGNVSYKTEDVTPVFWFHYTPDILVVSEAGTIKNFADFLKVAKAAPGTLNLGGSGLNSANHAAHERLNQDFGVKTTYVPYKGTGDLSLAVLGGHIDGAMTYTPFAIANAGKVRPIAVAMEARHPLLPDVPTFKELGVDWVDGAFRGIGVPKSTPQVARRRLSELFTSLNAETQMKELAAKAGFELVSVGVDGMDDFMRTRTRIYTDVGKRMGLGGGK